MATPAKVGIVVFAAMRMLWRVSESWIGLRHRASERSRDSGMLAKLALVIVGCMGLALCRRGRRPGVLPAWRPSLLRPGCTLMLTGRLFRWWAVRLLPGIR